MMKLLKLYLCVLAFALLCQQCHAFNFNGIATGLTYTIRTIASSVKQRFIPEDIRNHWTHDSTDTTWLKLLAVYSFAKRMGLGHIFSLSEENVTGEMKLQAPLVRLSDCQDKHKQIFTMAREIGLDPTTIYIGESNCTEIKHKKIIAAQTLYKNILIVDEQLYALDNQQEPKITEQERRFFIGHELAHIKQRHILKEIIVKLTAPFIIRCSMIVAHTLTQLGLAALRSRSPDHGHVIEPIMDIAETILCNSIIELVVINRIITYYLRSQEREADALSAQRFNCAHHGISLFHKMHNSFEKKFCWIKRAWYSFMDTHDTFNTRIKHLERFAHTQTDG